MAERLARSEVPVDETWRLDDMFQSMEAWEAELAAVERIIPQVAEFQGRLGMAQAFSESVTRRWSCLQGGLRRSLPMPTCDSRKMGRIL